MNDLIIPDFDPACIDVSDFASFSHKEILQTISTNIEAILQADQKRLADLYENGELKERVPEHNRQYAAGFRQSGRKKYPVGKNGVVSAFLLSHVHAATHYSDVSCHWPLFGQDKPVELFGKAAFFVSYFFRADPQTQQLVQQILAGGTCDIDNPAYIFQQRCAEIAHRQGKPLRSLLVFPGTSGAIAKNILRFSEVSLFPRTEDQEDTKLWNTSTVPARITCFLCALYDLSADFLLLRDYSANATSNGTALSPEQQGILSAFLLASVQAQSDAIRLLIQNTIYSEKVTP